MFTDILVYEAPVKRGHGVREPQHNSTTRSPTPNQAGSHPPIRARVAHTPQPAKNELHPLLNPTSSLDSLQGHKVLALLDIENLHHSADDWGCRMNFSRLIERLRQHCQQLWVHAYYSRHADEAWLDERFESMGFKPKPREIRMMFRHGGTKMDANSDPRIFAQGSSAISRSRADVVLLGSGDGLLVQEMADTIHGFPKQRATWTLSLAGSTSRMIQAAHNSKIEGNIMIGNDMLIQNPAHRGNGRGRSRYGLLPA